LFSRGRISTCFAIRTVFLMRVTSCRVLWQQEHSYVFRAYPLAIGTIATTSLALLQTMQPASPLIDYPPKLTNAICISEITSDSESRANRNDPKVVGAQARQLVEAADQAPVADAAEVGLPDRSSAIRMVARAISRRPDDSTLETTKTSSAMGWHGETVQPPPRHCCASVNKSLTAWVPNPILRIHPAPADTACSRRRKSRYSINKSLIGETYSRWRGPAPVPV
jgi:hypothetical protein